MAASCLVCPVAPPGVFSGVDLFEVPWVYTIPPLAKVVEFFNFCYSVMDGVAYSVCQEFLPVYGKFSVAGPYVDACHPVPASAAVCPNGAVFVYLGEKPAVVF